jgi:hypothetical protein
MPCESCKSVNVTEFTAEMVIHFSGIKNVANPGVLAFPKVLVCLDCGLSRFTLPEGELGLLRKGLAASSSPSLEVVNECVGSLLG